MMLTRNLLSIGVIALVLAAFPCAPARGQAAYTGQTAFQNLAASSSDAHAPGAMVNRGVARAQAAVRPPSAPFDITETEPIRDEYETARVETVESAVGEIMNLFNFLLVQYLQREGYDVALPDDSDSSTNGGSDRNDSDNGGKGAGRKVTFDRRTDTPGK
ncbi:MAG: hypothetical protein PVI86_16500 [Phycisphaerae bacterium]|jgi:hypothetical protein